METQTNQAPKFIRRRAVGSDYLVCNEDTPKVFVQILSSDFETDDSGRREQTYLVVTNLETNEKTKLWIGGQLKHTLSKMDTLKGAKLEINWKGRNEVVDTETGEVTRPNNYSVFELT